MATLDFHKALDVIAQNIVDLGAGPVIAMSRSEFVAHAAEQLVLAASEPPDVRAARLIALAQSVDNARNAPSESATVQVHLYDSGDDALLDDIARALVSVQSALRKSVSANPGSVAVVSPPAREQPTQAPKMQMQGQAKAQSQSQSQSQPRRVSKGVTTARQAGRRRSIVSDDAIDLSSEPVYDSPEWENLS